MSAKVGSLNVDLTLETARFNRGIREAQTSMGKFKSGMNKLAGAIGTAFVASIGVDTVRAMVDMGKAAVETVGALGEQAQQLGVTTDALQEFRFVASQTGIEQGEIDKALQRLTRTIGELAKPTKQQAEAMRALGLSTSALKGLGAGDALVVLSEAFAKLPDAATRSAVGFDLMGRSFQTLLPLLNEGPERINAMVKAAHDLGIVLTPEEIANADAYADQIAALNASVDAQKAAALAKYGKELVGLTRDYTQFKIDLINAFISIDRAGNTLTQSLSDFGKNSGIQNFFRTVDDAARVFGKTMHDIAVSIPAAIGRMVTGIGRWMGSALNAIWDNAKKRIDSVRQAFAALYDAVVGHSYIPDMVDGIAAEMARLDAVMVKPVTIATTKAEQAFRDMASNVQAMMDRLFPEVRELLDFRKDLETIGQLPEGIQQRARGRAIQEFAGPKTEPNFDDVGRLTEGVEDISDRIATATTDAAAGFTALQEITARGIDSLTSGLGQVLAHADSLSDAFKGMRDVFHSVIQDMLADLIKLQLQKAIMGLIGNVLGGAAGLGGLSKGAFSGGGALKGFAAGTSFAPGGLALVGERGPELVNLPRGSQVIPNSDLRGMGAPVFNIHVSGAMSDRDARRTGHQIGSAANQRMAQARRTGIAG